MTKCKHETDVIYGELIQIDGQPMYLVRCVDCGEYGTIELVEDKNTFGMTFEQVEELKKDNALK